jgi:hypothetical protein
MSRNDGPRIIRTAVRSAAQIAGWWTADYLRVLRLTTDSLWWATCRWPGRGCSTVIWRCDLGVHFKPFSCVDAQDWGARR